MSKYLTYLLVILGLCFSGFALAEVLAVPVPDQSAVSKEKAIQTGINDVLVRLSGNPNIMSLPAARSIQASADRYVETYSYNTVMVQNQPQLQLSVSFDEASLVQFLQSIHQTVFTGQRPLTLLWISVNDQQSPIYVVSSNLESTALLNSIKTAATQAALPILLPSMDLQDQSYLNFTSSTFDASELQKAAKRYAVRSILAANLIKTPEGTWQAQWLLLANGQSNTWSDQAPTFNRLFSQGFISADRNLIKPVENAVNTPTQFVVNITGIDDLEAYASLMRYLKQLPIITAVSAEGVGSQQLTLSITSTVDATHLSSALLANTHLKAVTGAPLSYVWSST